MMRVRRRSAQRSNLACLRLSFPLFAFRFFFFFLFCFFFSLSVCHGRCLYLLQQGLFRTVGKTHWDQLSSGIAGVCGPNQQLGLI